MPILQALATAAWLATSLLAQTGPPDAAAAPVDPEALAAAIEVARREATTPFRLQVDCTDDRGSRSLLLFPSGVATWSRRAQVALTDADRSLLLEVLLERDFAHFAPRYGGRPDAPAKAALRISCRVELEIDGLQKSSIQLVDGEQSPHLIGLAADLLDLVEPLAADANLVADDLDDGLRKLAEGILTPEALELRWVRLPTPASGEAGTVVRIEGGRTSRQVYTPGRELGQVEFEPLDPARLAELIEAIRRAEIWTWPANLWSDAQVELEVRVLDQSRAIVARRFARLSPGGPGKAQEQFDQLARALLDFERSPNPPRP